MNERTNEGKKWTKTSENVIENENEKQQFVCEKENVKNECIFNYFLIMYCTMGHTSLKSMSVRAHLHTVSLACEFYASCVCVLRCHIYWRMDRAKERERERTTRVRSSEIKSEGNWSRGSVRVYVSNLKHPFIAYESKRDNLSFAWIEKAIFLHRFRCDHSLQIHAADHPATYLLYGQFEMTLCGMDRAKKMPKNA